MLSQESSLAEFQKLNRDIYLQVNDRNYSTPDLFYFLHRHITCILKATRKNMHGELAYHLCMSLSWSFGMANRYHIDLAKKLWELFPGCCPYCSGVPCRCKEFPNHRQKLPRKASENQPIALKDWQLMFEKVYPATIQNSAMHLAEGAGEVAEAIRCHTAMHQEQWFLKIVEELCDLITHIFAVATCLKLDLASGMVDYFSRGCPKCREITCGCGYLMFDQAM